MFHLLYRVLDLNVSRKLTFWIHQEKWFIISMPLASYSLKHFWTPLSYHLYLFIYLYYQSWWFFLFSFSYNLNIFKELFTFSQTHDVFIHVPYRFLLVFEDFPTPQAICMFSVVSMFCVCFFLCLLFLLLGVVVVVFLW